MRSFQSGKQKQDHQSILVKASLAHSEGRLDDAERGYLKVLKKKPGWGQVWNALGTVYLDKSNLDKASSCFRKAANLRPPHLPACYNLARIQQQQNDHAAASALYHTILEQQPEYGEVWNNLGIACKETGKLEEGQRCFRQAVKFAPEMAEAWNNLGVVQDQLNTPDQAVESYAHAIAIHPDYTSAHFNLGSSLQKLKRYEEAEVHFRKVLEIDPGDEPAKFMLQTMGAIPVIPEAAPVEHVRRIFDQCAGTFEKTLVEDLEYRTPELLFDRVRPYLKTNSTVLDLGCGTGLGAQLYRPFADLLIGVDISPGMLARAAEKKLYDELELFDILQEWSFPYTFDLIYSSDVFVYFGNLDKILGPLSSYLVSGGIVAFSVERLEENGGDFHLHPGGRYAHTREYVEKCLRRNGLQLLEAVNGNIRKQSGSRVKGLLVTARKNPG